MKEPPPHRSFISVATLVWVVVAVVILAAMGREGALQFLGIPPDPYGRNPFGNLLLYLLLIPLTAVYAVLFILWSWLPPERIRPFLQPGHSIWLERAGLYAGGILAVIVYFAVSGNIDDTSAPYANVDIANPSRTPLLVVVLVLLLYFLAFLLGHVLFWIGRFLWITFHPPKKYVPPKA